MLTMVDEDIQVPYGVRGEVLRQRLEDVYPTKAAAPNTKSGLRLSTGWLSWQSGFSYAAAFALIVSLFYGLGFDRQTNSIVDDSIQLQSAQPQGETQERVAITSDTDVSAQSAVPEVASFSEASPRQMPQPAAIAEESTQQVVPFGITQTPDVGGVGGGSMTLLSDTYNGYVFTWRTNDSADPQKGQYPITVDIMDKSSQFLVSQIDVPDIQTVESHYFADNRLFFTGQFQDGVMTRVYNIQEAVHPVEVAAIASPGSTVASRQYNGIYRTVTYAPDASSVTCEVEPLPNSVQEGVCVITSIQLDQGGYQQKAFSGAGEETLLYDFNAYIQYQSQTAEETEPSVEYARIALEELSITLSGIEDQ